MLRDIPAALTPEGAEVFGTYPAGEALDPVTLSLPVADCEAGAPSEVSATGAESAASAIPAWLVWALIAVLLAAIVVAGVVAAAPEAGGRLVSSRDGGEGDRGDPLATSREPEAVGRRGGHAHRCPDQPGQQRLDFAAARRDPRALADDLHGEVADHDSPTRSPGRASRAGTSRSSRRRTAGHSTRIGRPCRRAPPPTAARRRSRGSRRRRRCGRRARAHRASRPRRARAVPSRRRRARRRRGRCACPLETPSTFSARRRSHGVVILNARASPSTIDTDASGLLEQGRVVGVLLRGQRVGRVEGRPRESLRRLHVDEIVAVDGRHDLLATIDALDGVADRERRDDPAALRAAGTNRRDHPVEQRPRREGTGRVVHEHDRRPSDRAPRGRRRPTPGASRRPRRR